MSTDTRIIRESIDVEVPVSMAYEAWNHFESFPLFMEGLERIERIDGSRARWVAEIGGVRREWISRITELIPNRRIAWMSEGGEEIGGTVDFEPLSEDRARVTVEMTHEPHGLVESLGETLGFVGRRVRGDLERFKHHVETQAAGRRV
jgi:uncharacterized membrane protein